MRCLDVAILDAGQMGASGLKVMKPLTDYKATGPSQWKSSLSLSLSSKTCRDQTRSMSFHKEDDRRPLHELLRHIVCSETQTLTVTSQRWNLKSQPSRLSYWPMRISKMANETNINWFVNCTHHLKSLRSEGETRGTSPHATESGTPRIAVAPPAEIMHALIWPAVAGNK